MRQQDISSAGDVDFNLPQALHTLLLGVSPYHTFTSTQCNAVLDNDS